MSARSAGPPAAPKRIAGKILATAMAAACLALPPAAARAEQPWTVTRDFTSPIDGKRTFIVRTTREDTGIEVGCHLDRPSVTFTLDRQFLRSRTRASGAYRIDSRAPAYITWEGIDSLVWKLEGEEAAALIRGLFTATVLHIRIDDFERTIRVSGLQDHRSRFTETCLAAR